jgi:uncharacterized protein (TIGR02611 family)
VAEDGGDGPHLAERLRRRREEHRRRSKLYRVAFAVAGVVVTLVGIGMLILPGPALVVIPIGLAMLAMEFRWAERALEYALRKAEEAQQKAKQTSKGERIALSVVAAIAVAAFVVAAVLWDIPLLPVV